MKKYDKRDAVLISAVFGTINMVTVWMVFYNKAF